MSFTGAAKQTSTSLKLKEPQQPMGKKRQPTESSLQAASKKASLKTKTLIDAMQTLSLIPSFSTSNFGGKSRNR